MRTICPHCKQEFPEMPEMTAETRDLLGDIAAVGEHHQFAEHAVVMRIRSQAVFGKTPEQFFLLRGGHGRGRRAGRKLRTPQARPAKGSGGS